MSKYIGPVCRLCRREGDKLFLKGERCFSQKCAINKRGYAPGQHGKNKQGRSDTASVYGTQLRAKQRARRVYGVFERQFRRFYGLALKRRGMTGLNLLQNLELRLDNVIYRLGFAENRAHARQLVNHGHFMVNGRRCNIPSMLIKVGDVLELRDGSKELTYFKELPDFAEKRECQPWLERDIKILRGRCLRMPERAEIDGSLNEQLIVEFYSR